MRLRSAEWLATTRCNSRCSHCCADAGSPRTGELEEGEATRVLAELADLGVEHLCISGGELTLRPDWERLVRFALSRFPDTAIITNGQLGRRLVDALEAMAGCSTLTVLVSIDGMREVHDARRGAGAFDRALEVLQARRRFQTAILTTVGRDNQSELEAIGRLAADAGVVEWSLQPAIPMGRMAPEGFVGRAGLLALADFICAARTRSGGGMRIATNCWFGYFHAMRDGAPWRGCPAGHEQLAVLPQGDVSACVGVDAWVCGNVRRQSLREIWEGAAMEALRSARPSSCGGCSRCPRGCEMIERALGAQHC